MESQRPSLLLKANREIAEVRESLLRIDTQLDDVQAKNRVLLEETSVQDTEASRLYARTAVSESRLAELFERKRVGLEELEAQQAARGSSLVSLRAEVAERQEVLRQEEAATREAEAQKEEQLQELRRLHELQEVETTSLAACRATKEAGALGSQPSAASAALQQSLEAEVQAKEAQHADLASSVASAQQHAGQLRSALAAKRGQREELARRNRQVEADCQSEASNLRALEAAVESQGGDVSAIGEGVSNADARATELQTELVESEEQCRRLEVTLREAAERSAQDVDRLQNALDSARDELQRSMREAAEAHGNEVANLESEVQAERQRANLEAIAEDSCADRKKQLLDSLSRLQEQRAALQLGALAKVGQSETLKANLASTRAEVSSAEQQIQELRERILQSEQRRWRTKADGDREAMKVRVKITEIWQRLTAVTMTSC
eukprot:TRINITY_DN41477_c0_g1_i1.p1 TRINITY_DN41477_c0_g1~~TRINITY_DN41477_c0_g1_i1.p1  ORF type:complete len:440 (-),score=152.11 TRINITY_DN41477_c0_g1_i1:9-1328(-)